jgi:hypothetical protein
MWSTLCLWLSSPALALTQVQGGPAFDLAAGLGLRGAPLRPALGGQASFGWWSGVYDDQYAFGRYWWLGATVRADWRPDAFGLTPMIELRRGIELIVVGVAPFVAGGLTLQPDGGVLGFTGRAGVGLKLRRTRYFGLSLRVEAGVDVVDEQVGFAGGVLVGPSFARPLHGITEPEI